MAPKRVLITGASGLLGRSLMKHFNAAGWETLGLAYSRVSDLLVKVDITNQEQVKKILDQFQPTFVIHAAAQRFPDKVDKEYEESYNLNVTSTKHLAQLTWERKIPLLFISTDYVYDGKNPPYKHSDPPNPINTYGKTKAEAEKVVLQTNSQSCILRIPVLYGDEEYLGESAVSVLLKILLNKSQPCKVSHYELRYPAHTDDVAFICEELLDKKLKDSSVEGIYQCCGSEKLTKYEMTKIMSEAFKQSMEHIQSDPEPGSGTQRPYNTQLSTERLRLLGIEHSRSFKEGIMSFKNLLP